MLSNNIPSQPQPVPSSTTSSVCGTSIPCDSADQFKFRRLIKWNVLRLCAVEKVSDQEGEGHIAARYSRGCATPGAPKSDVRRGNTPNGEGRSCQQSWPASIFVGAAICACSSDRT